jgi:hypothetical protein
MEVINRTMAKDLTCSWIMIRLSILGGEIGAKDRKLKTAFLHMQVSSRTIPSQCCGALRCRRCTHSNLGKTVQYLTQDR